jgi:hypothetical protein
LAATVWPAAHFVSAPDAETVKRFVKGYIDVGEIASQRGSSEAK